MWRGVDAKPFLALADRAQIDHHVVLVGPPVNTDRAEHEMLEAHRLEYRFEVLDLLRELLVTL
jgi:hypothetical protein